MWKKVSSQECKLFFYIRWGVELRPNLNLSYCLPKWLLFPTSLMAPSFSWSPRIKMSVFLDVSLSLTSHIKSLSKGRPILQVFSWALSYTYSVLPISLPPTSFILLWLKQRLEVKECMCTLALDTSPPWGGGSEVRWRDTREWGVWGPGPESMPSHSVSLYPSC